MLVRLTGQQKNYDWGSKTLIQDHFGLGESIEPVAEVWFGTHPGGESTVSDSGEKLSLVIGSKLSFLTKYLAADYPLSIQVHPNTEQAKAGFAREQTLGLLDPKRNYRDDSHKPEILVAISSFSALCGFRPRPQLEQIFLAFSESEKRFGELAARLRSGAPIEEVFEDLLQDSALASRFCETVGLAQGFEDQRLVLEARDLALSLLEKFPTDTGALVAPMLNHIELEPGQAIFLPAGNVHAYLAGFGLEVMAASDNVIRAGLTKKHVDQDELLRVADFTELADPVVRPLKVARGLVEYPVAVSEFRLYRAELTGFNLLADLDLPAGAMVLCTSGEVALSTSLEEREVLKKSDAVYLTKVKKFSLSGSGTAYVVLGS